MIVYNLHVVAHILRAGGTSFNGNANNAPLSREDAESLRDQLQSAIGRKNLNFLVLFNDQSETMLTESILNDAVITFTVRSAIIKS